MNKEEVDKLLAESDTPYDFANACEKIGMEKAAIEAELRGKRLGRKYALMEIGNMVWVSDKKLSKKLQAMANEIEEV